MEDNRMTSTKRAMAALALGAIALPLLSTPSALADGEATPPAPRSVASFCAGVADAGFTDVAADDTFRSEINCIAAANITRGLQGGNQYGGTLPVSRAQMASFIARMLDTAEQLDLNGRVRPLPEVADVSRFRDVGGGDGHPRAINRLAAVGIVQGGPAGLPADLYGPTLNVSRAQMASFVIRSLEFALDIKLSTAEDYFTDDAKAVPHQDNINTIASLAIAVGDGKDSYTPGRATSRGQMAAFIARSLAYLESQQLIRPLVTNQSFTVTPASAMTLPLGGDAASRTRTYSVATPAAGAVHQIQLMPRENVGVEANRTFRDVDQDKIADVGTLVARVSSVNNVPLTGSGARASAVPVAGAIIFTVEGSALESLVPVVFLDNDDNGGLSLGADAEPFGVGGAITFVNQSATSQFIAPSNAQRVVRVNRGTNQFDLGESTFTYDANDTFSISLGIDAPALPASLEQFRAALSRGDLVSGTYSADPALSSSFRLVDVSPMPPAVVSAEAGTAQSTNEITITVSFALNADVERVVIQRAVVTDGKDETPAGTFGPFMTITSFVPTAAQLASGMATYRDSEVPEGVYRYRAALMSDGQQSSFTLDANNEASVRPIPLDVTAPTLIATTLITDAGFAGSLDPGDVFTLRASEPLRSPIAENAFRIQDADGTIVEVVCGGAGNATCALNREDVPVNPPGPNAGSAAGSLITVILMDAPAAIAPGTMPGLQYPGTIIGIAGIVDLAGNRLALHGDVTIDARA
jgi:hypothetical protein